MESVSSRMPIIPVRDSPKVKQKEMPFFHPGILSFMLPVLRLIVFRNFQFVNFHRRLESL